MAWAVIASAEGQGDSAGTTLDCSSSLNVAEGDLLVAWCKHEGTNGTFAIAKSGGGSPANTFTFDAGDEENHSNADLNGSFGYKIAANADATATFTLTTASKAFRRVIIYQCRPDAGDTVSKAGAAEGQGNGFTPASGALTISGDDLIVFGGVGEYADQTYSNRVIDSTAAAAFQDAGTSDTSMWYRILTTGFTSKTAQVTQDQDEDWICNIIAFTSVAAAGTAVPVIMRQYRQRRS